MDEAAEASLEGGDVMQVRPDHPHIYHTMDSNWSQAVHEAVLIKLRTIAYNKLDYVADQLFYMCRYIAY